MQGHHAGTPTKPLREVGWEGLAATDFPVPWGTVSWALAVFTSEFGMGSGVCPPPWPPDRLSQPRATASLARPAQCVGMGAFRVMLALWRVRFWHSSACVGADAELRWMAAVHGGPFVWKGWLVGMGRAVRAIRTSWLSALLRVYLWPIHVMVCHGPRGDLVSRSVSRLDAFSGYLVRT